MVKCMWRKHRTVYHYHLKYICNDIVKLFCVRNLRYAERVQEMHDLAKCLPPPSIKGDIYEEDNWEGRGEELSMNDIIIEIKDGPPSSMQYKLEDNQEDYSYLTHEYWCDLFSTIKVKDNRKRSATQIKKIASDRASYLSDNDRFVRIPRKKKSRTGFLRNNKGPNNRAPKHNVTQRYCVLCKKAGNHEKEYMSHSDEECFGKCSNQKKIKYGLGRPMRSRSESVKQYKNSESKWKKEFNTLKKQNKISYSIAKTSGSRREIKKINKIRYKATKKRCDGSSNSYSDD